MVHLSTPGPDTGHFSTLEVRPRNKPTQITSRIIAFPRKHYKEPPNVAGGFKMLDLSHKAPGVRANLVGSDLTKDEFRITLETWDKGRLYAAEATWIEHKAGSRECHFGQFDTRDVERDRRRKMNGKRASVDYSHQGTNTGVRQENGDTGAANGANGNAEKEGAQHQQQEWSKTFRFPVTFERPPSVICWLNRLDLASDQDRNFRIRCYATNITPSHATFHISSWGDSILNGAAMCWIAFPEGKKHVDSGTIATSDVRQWFNPRPTNSARVAFREGAFQRKPTMLVALNMVDMAGNADLRVKVDIPEEEVDADGFTWHLDTWVSDLGFGRHLDIADAV
jgi:H-type lectin domain